MSSSFVPKVKMTKGTAKNNKFDVSVNCHTTSEVGYLQPTFSKILTPNSSLKIKSSSSILLSSLVCPTFGDLHLRSWYMATPVSSLWAALGAFLSGSAFPDEDSPSGNKIPKQMPKVSQAALIRYLSWWPIYKYCNDNISDSVQNIPCPNELLGNLSYILKRNGYDCTNELMDIDELQTLVLASDDAPVQFNGFFKYVVGHSKNGSSYHNGFPVEYFDDLGYRLSIPDEADYALSDIMRYSCVFPWWWTGHVIKNSSNLRRMLTDKDGVCSFPEPDVCPYVVCFCPELSKDNYKVACYDSYPEGMTAGEGGMYFYPLTLRMFQGDTDRRLYFDGWRNDRVKYDSKFYHPNGKSFGWSLLDDDAYYTGEIPQPKKFDCVATQVKANAGDVTSSNVEFFLGVRYSRRFKRIRKVFIGLGNQFNPFDTDQITPWKLMSYYKGWFDNFYPKRDIQYYQTPLARLVNYLSYHSRTWDYHFMYHLFTFDDDLGNITSVQPAFRDFIDLIYAVGDAKYLMPLDYFTLADLHPLNENETQDESIQNVTGFDTGGMVTPFPSSSQKEIQGVQQGVEYASASEPLYPGYTTLDGWAVKMADKMLHYLTKKRVVGRSVSDLMRAIFGGVDEHDKAHESTWCFGTHSTPIQISAVMSQAETEEMHLGDYAGRGLGGDTSREFSVDVGTDILVVYVMSALVPRLGYYQGNLRENLVGDSPNDFCKPLWDAVGYEDVYVSEYIADTVHKVNLRNPSSDPSARGMSNFNKYMLGLVPRYTWYKTSRDILNGDMSLPSLKESMNPYVLTRDVDTGFSLDPLEMRTIVPDSFNKIFNESSSLDDHFIVQLGHQADLYAPLKSLSTSFEDFDESEDGVVEVEHS